MTQLGRVQMRRPSSCRAQKSLPQSVSLMHSSFSVWHANEVPPQPGRLVNELHRKLAGQSASWMQLAATHCPTGLPHKQTCPGPHSMSATQPYTHWATLESALGWQ